MHTVLPLRFVRVTPLVRSAKTSERGPESAFVPEFVTVAVSYQSLVVESYVNDPKSTDTSLVTEAAHDKLAR